MATDPSPVPGAARSVVLIGPAHIRRLAGALAVGGPVIEFEPELDGAAPVSRSKDQVGFDAARALVVCVPVGLTAAQGADTARVAATAQRLAAGVRPGQLVLMTGPVPPGTTRDVLLPPLLATGLTPGRDFGLAYSTFPTAAPVVGGLTEDCAEAAVGLLARAGVTTTRLSSLEAAEVCGTLADAARSVQRAFEHELRIACERWGADAEEVLRTGPWDEFGSGRDSTRPEAFLAWGARRKGLSLRLLSLASEIGTEVPEHLARSVSDALNSHGLALRGSRIAVLGATEEPERGSACGSGPALLALLRTRGAVIESLPVLPAAAPESSGTALTPYDCVLLLPGCEHFDHSTVPPQRPVVDLRAPLASGKPHAS